MCVFSTNLSTYFQVAKLACFECNKTLPKTPLKEGQAFLYKDRKQTHTCACSNKQTHIHTHAHTQTHTQEKIHTHTKIVKIVFFLFSFFYCRRFWLALWLLIRKLIPMTNFLIKRSSCLKTALDWFLGGQI